MPSTELEAVIIRTICATDQLVELVYGPHLEEI